MNVHVYQRFEKKLILCKQDLGEILTTDVTCIRCIGCTAVLCEAVEHAVDKVKLNKFSESEALMGCESMTSPLPCSVKFMTQLIEQKLLDTVQ